MKSNFRYLLAPLLLVLVLAAPASARLVLNNLIGFGAVSATGVGGNDANALMLLHMDGSDTSTTFNDSSVGGSTHNATAVGNAQIDTAQSKFGGASGLFDGTGDYLTVADHADFDFGTGDLTIDGWIRPTLSAQGYVYDWRAGSTATMYLIVETDGSINAAVGTAMTAAASTLSASTWHHVALVRSSGTIFLFVDGVQKDTDSDSSTINLGGTLYIGTRNTITTDFGGHMDELRVSDVARWTSNFTPPAGPYN